MSLFLRGVSGSNSSSDLDKLAGMGGLDFLKRYADPAVIDSPDADYYKGSGTTTVIADRSAANPAKYYDIDGILRDYLTANKLRHTYGVYTDLGFIRKPGILQERQSTNLLLYSNDLSNAAWTKTNVVINGKDSSLVLQFKLNESAENASVDDASLKGYDGVSARNTSLLSVAGKIGNCFNFNGSTDLISIVDNPDLRMISGGTIMGWIKPDGYGGGNQGRIIDKSTGTNAQNGYYIRYSSPGLLYMKVNSESNSAWSTNNSVQNGVWQHFAVTFAATGRRFYINGVDVTGTGTGNSLPPDVAGVVKIGNRASSSDRGFDGGIDDLRVYNRVLTQTEIAAIYAEEDEDDLVLNGKSVDDTYNTQVIKTSAANGTVTQQVTSTGDNVGSFFLKRKSGTGYVWVSVDNGLTVQLCYLSSSVWRRFKSSASVINPTVMIKIYTSGDEILFCHSQVETRTNPTTPIYTTDQAVTRNAESVSFLLVGNRNSRTETFFLHFTNLAELDANTSSRIFCDTSNPQRLLRKSLGGSTTISFKPNLTNSSSSGCSSPTFPLRRGESYVTCMVSDYQIGTKAYINGVLEDEDDTVFTDNAWVGGSFYLGGSNAGSGADIIIHDVAAYGKVLNDADVLTVSRIFYNNNPDISFGLFSDMHLDLVAPTAGGASASSNSVLAAAVDVWNLDSSVRFIVGLGDNIDGDSKEDDIYNLARIDDVLDSFKKLSYLIMGSHDVEKMSRSEFITNCRHIVSPGYYSFDLWGWHFICLDGGDGGSPYVMSSDQLAWLAADLSASSLPKVVFIHAPVYLNYPGNTAVITETGDGANQLSNWVFSGMTLSNSDVFKVYWSLSDSEGTRIVSIYSDSAKTIKVAEGSLVGDGLITLSEVGGSGLSGSVTVTYTSDDTDASNTVIVGEFTAYPWGYYQYNAKDTRELLEAVQNVKVVFSGHLHNDYNSVVNGIRYFGLQNLSGGGDTATIRLRSDGTIKMAGAGNQDSYDQ